MKYKLVEKGNLSKPEEPKKWYANPVNAGKFTIKDFAREIAGRSSLTRGSIEKSVVFLVCMLCAVINLQAQQKFNVQNGAKTAFYDDLETAVQQAVSGDTIYLPGAEVQVKDNLIIDKKLALIGAGTDIDSIGGLKRTEIKKETSYGNINFREGSNGSLLTGCTLGNIVFGYKDEVNDSFDNIEDVLIFRNDLNSILLGVNTVQNLNKVKKITIRDNNLHYSGVGGSNIYGYYATECFISNNLFNGRNSGISQLKNSYIYNNVINSNDTYALRDVLGCFFQNNYFRAGSYLYYCENNSFYNNAFDKDITFPTGTNSGANNLVNQETIKTFQVNDLTLPKNLKIRDASPCKNAGSDGTDIGIYGGSQPYKAGAVPFNPHISRSFISTQTDKGGKLPVNIVVTAQDR